MPGITRKMAPSSGTIEPILLTLGLTITSTVPPGRSRFTSIPEALRAWLLSACPSGTKAIQFLTSRHSVQGFSPELYTQFEGGNKASLDGVNEYRLEINATLLFGASSDASR